MQKKEPLKFILLAWVLASAMMLASVWFCESARAAVPTPTPISYHIYRSGSIADDAQQDDPDNNAKCYSNLSSFVVRTGANWDSQTWAGARVLDVEEEGSVISAFLNLYVISSVVTITDFNVYGENRGSPDYDSECSIYDRYIGYATTYYCHGTVDEGDTGWCVVDVTTAVNEVLADANWTKGSAMALILRPKTWGGYGWTTFSSAVSYLGILAYPTPTATPIETPIPTATPYPSRTPTPTPAPTLSPQPLTIIYKGVFF